MRIVQVCLAAFMLAFVTVGCSHHPPNLSPQGIAAYNGTKAIQTLDLLRDAATTANAQTPPLLADDATRKVVTYHKGAIQTIHSLPDGWQSTVTTGLDELVKALTPAEAKFIEPYTTLIKTIIASVTK